MIAFFTLIQEGNRNKYGEIRDVLDISIEKFMKEWYGACWPVIMNGGLTTGAHLYAFHYDGVWVEVPDLEYAKSLIGKYAPVPMPVKN